MSFPRTPGGWIELRGPARPGPFLRTLMVTLVVVFAFQGPLRLESFGVLHPEEVWNGRLDQLFWYGWLHGDLLHLLFNLFGIWVFGSELERIWDGRTLAIYWMSCVVGAGLAHALIDPLISGENIGVLGASGGVYGLLAAYGLIFRQRKLLLLGIVPIRAGTLALIFGLFALWSGVAQGQESIAHFAHLGGMLTGVLLLYGRPGLKTIRLWWHRQRMQSYAARAEARPRESEAAPEDKPAPQNKGSEFPTARMDRDAINRSVDRLLEKVSRGGMDSLSPEERRYLDKASRYLKSLRDKDNA